MQKSFIGKVLSGVLFLVLFAGALSANISGVESSSVDIRTKIGQMLMPDFRNWGKDKDGDYIPFTQSNAGVEELISRYNFGGIILFRENTVNPAQTIRLVHSLQSASIIPLLIGIDQEGGMVVRLQSGTDMPGNMVLGAARNPEVTQRVAEAIGDELFCQGINLDLAPDIDVNVNPKNPIIGVRSFGSSSKLVAEMGTAYIEGLAKSNVLSCAKHFPGHGDTASDTHLGLAIVDHDIGQLNDIDLYPFIKAIEAGVPCIMAAHVIVPVLDDAKLKSKKDGKFIGTPSTLSYPIITTLLREKMNFRGLVLTDAMDMKAISDNFGTVEATVMAVEAGCDIILMPVRVWSSEDIPAMEEFIAALENEYKTNSTFKAAVDASSARITEFKKQYKLHESIISGKDVPGAIAKAEKIVGSQNHKALESEASEAGVTLVKNDNILPFRMENGSSILILDANSLRLGIAESEINTLARKNSVNVNLKKVKIDYSKELSPELEAEIKEADLCMLFTYNLTSLDILPGQITEYALKNRVKCVAVACRNPYDITYMPDAGAALCIYGAVGFDQTNAMLSVLKINLISGIRTMFIDNKTSKAFNMPKGKLPVDIPSADGSKILYPFGEGLTY